MRPTRAGLAAVAASAAVLAVPAAAQVPLTPRALGMGGAYLAVARGQEVVFQNPANLALPGNPHWSIAFPQIMAGGSALGLEAGDIADIADYDDISNDRAQEILDAIPASGTDVEYDLRIPIAAFQVRRFAFGVSYGSTGNHTVDKDLVDLLLRGYDPASLRNYQAPNTVGRRATFVDLALSHARRFGPVSVGVTGHYYIGRELVSARLLDIQEPTLPNPTVEATYIGIRSEGGNGFGVDVGAAIQPTPALTLSASVSNAFSTMNWSDGLRQRSVTITESDLENGEFSDLESRYANSDAEFTGSANAQVNALANTLTDEADFPAQLRLGAAWSPTAATQIAASYQGDLADSRLTGLWDKQVGIGIQQKIPVVTLRAGFASNLDDGSMLTGGLSLGPLQFGVARLDRGELDGADRKGWVVSFGVTARTNSVMP